MAERSDGRRSFAPGLGCRPLRPLGELGNQLVQAIKPHPLHPLKIPQFIQIQRPILAVTAPDIIGEHVILAEALRIIVQHQIVIPGIHFYL